MKQNYTVDATQNIPIKKWDHGVIIEDAAVQQLHNVANLPFVYRHVAVMPDAHWGMGSTVGSVIATKGAIIPAAVGVDVGCGMCAVRTGLTASDLPDNMLAVRAAIEKAVPHGRTNDGRPGDRGAWGNPSDDSIAQWLELSSGFMSIMDKHPKLMSRDPRQQTINHMGTLGTGNHFVEICLDEDQHVWAMLHSGSRGVGNRIGTYFTELAKADMRKWFINLPDVDLAYFPEGTDHYDDYLEAMLWAQEYASSNRKVMMRATLCALFETLGVDQPLFFSQSVVDCHHNYASKEHHFGNNVWVTRKGAVRARTSDLGIIPGSMGAKSFIVRGKGDAESFHSCSHGAGRAMSRGQAKKQFTVFDHELATAGVECRKDVEVLDETPGAYKNIDAVMAAQSDLVEVVHTLKQIVCVKG